MADWKTGLRRVGQAAQSAAREVGNAASEHARAAARPTHVCTQCGYVGKPSMQASTNGCFAIVLLCCFIIPGILYIVFTSRGRAVCPKCRKVESMIPLDAPQARVLTAATHRQTAPAAPVAPREERRCPYCAELILVQARVCKHCGRDVERLQ